MGFTFSELLNVALFQMNVIVERFFKWLPFENEKELCIICDKRIHDNSDPYLEETQDELLKRTLRSAVYKEFPTHPELRCAFFKKLVRLLEKYDGVEINEDIYKAVYLNEEDLENSQTFYKSYFQNDGTYLCSLIESKEFVIKGTTGLKTWPAAEFLLQLFFKENILQENDTVLELGCGIGMIGISLLQCGKVKKVIFTDHSESVLEVVKQNLHKNGIHNENSFHVQKLDWEKNETEVPDHDLVIGSDIVFDQRIIPSLVRTLKVCFKKSKKPAIVANVER